MAQGLGDWLTLVSVAVVAPPPLWDIPQESTPRLPSLVGPSVRSFVPFTRSDSCRRRFLSIVSPPNFRHVNAGRTVSHPPSPVFSPRVFSSKNETLIPSINARLYFSRELRKQKRKKKGRKRTDSIRQEGIIRFLFSRRVSLFCPSSHFNHPRPHNKFQVENISARSRRSIEIHLLPPEKHAKRTRTCHRKS